MVEEYISDQAKRYGKDQCDPETVYEIVRAGSRYLFKADSKGKGISDSLI